MSAAIPASGLLVGVFAALRDSNGRLLLLQRSDLDMWCLPGGLLEVGESVSECAVRECAEEIGVEVEVGTLVGVYTDPKTHLFTYRNGDVKQYVSVIFLAKVVSGEPFSASHESRQIGYFDHQDLPLVVPSHRVWIDDVLTGGEFPYVR